MEKKLDSLLNANTIKIFDNSAQRISWKDAVKMCLEPLLENGSIEKRYIDAVISTVEKTGPYINLGNSIALPHSRPENGVLKIGMTLLKLSEPVDIQDSDHRAQLFFGLAATDNNSHLDALAALSNTLMNQSKVDKLKTAENVEEIIKIIFHE
ncbi:MAG: PTS sugar transporter subunit IIA [Bifidobacteriaceae bacterium]|jgi:mannitol/fructose-specific phosphotransferase system IIA component (Ntr-type)|nr:PTS sugar transporter subunit IIA [Bifidobacteriaceae bacterium]